MFLQVSVNARAGGLSMPIYEYECQACEHRFEAEQHINDPHIKTCPKCGKDEVKKLISRSNFQLSGQGWYSDGYSKGPQRKKAN
jgi:putative FmdB family regulatory protein